MHKPSTITSPYLAEDIQKSSPTKRAFLLKTYGIPHIAGFNVLYYRADLPVAAGLEVPRH